MKKVNKESTFNQCTPISSPPAKIPDKVESIMEHVRKINEARKKTQIPRRNAPKVERSQSLRDRPNTFSITQMVEANCAVAATKERSKCNINSFDSSGSTADVGQGGNPGETTEVSSKLSRPGFRFHRAATFKMPTCNVVQRESNVPTNSNVNPATITSSEIEMDFDSIESFPATPTKPPLKKTFAELRAKYKGISPVEESVPRDRPRNLSRVIASYDQEIRQKIPSFPSAICQQSGGANYTPNWSWHQSYVKFQQEAANMPSEFEKHNVILEFYLQVKSAASILDQIRHDFQEGLQDYNPRDPHNAVDKICNDMNVCRVGLRGRNTVSFGTVHFLKDIFQSELTKQEKYRKWTARIITDPTDARRRNETVAWVVKIAKLIKYPAETAHLAVHYIDAYLTIKGNRISSCTWGLLGVTALHIAGKLEEPDPASASRLNRLCSQFYQIDEVHWMEKDIVRKLQFDMYPPLAPLFAHMVLLGGTLRFDNINLRKLALDLSLGILHRSLLNHRLVTVPPADKAKVALEIAVDFIFNQHRLCVKRDMSAYTTTISEPGLALGELALNMCTETFNHRFLNRRLLNVKPAVTCVSSPVRDIKA